MLPCEKGQGSEQGVEELMAQLVFCFSRTIQSSPLTSCCPFVLGLLCGCSAYQGKMSFVRPPWLHL
jgi:hypothetical protein